MEQQQAVSDEAVEAAARAEFEYEFRKSPAKWEVTTDEIRIRYRIRATYALEAAAPHLMADRRAAEDRLLAMAWSEGAMAATVTPAGVRLVNPFREK